MVKKIGALVLLIGGILGAIGGITAFVTLYSIGEKAEKIKSYSEMFAFINSLNSDIKKVMDMAVLARVGAIILFIAAIIVTVGVFMEGSKKNGAISCLIFGVAAFAGQFMINPLTSAEAAANFVASESASETVTRGLIFIGVSGVILAINGLIILVSKKKNINFVG